jgi:hypothetical protein
MGTTYGQRSRVAAGKKTHLLRQFILKTDRFTKTGPGQTQGKYSKKRRGFAYSVPSPRTFIIHEYDDLEKIYAYRSGDWKISWGGIAKGQEFGYIPDIDYKKAACTALLPATGVTSDASVELQPWGQVADADIEDSDTGRQPEVTKTPFLVAIFLMQNNNLPRQARDKHQSSPQTNGHFRTGGRWTGAAVPRTRLLQDGGRPVPLQRRKKT